MDTKTRQVINLSSIFKSEEIQEQKDQIDQIHESFIPMICQIGAIGYNLKSSIALTDRTVHLANHFNVSADHVFKMVKRGLSFGKENFINHAFAAAEKKLRRDNNRKYRELVLKGQIN